MKCVFFFFLNANDLLLFYIAGKLIGKNQKNEKMSW